MLKQCIMELLLREGVMLMQVSLPIIDGYLPDKYGKYATKDNKYNGQPSLSFPIKLTDLPIGTVTTALVLLDYDAIPVSGFTWIHWTAANISATMLEIPENASQSDTLKMIQGRNSTAGGLVGATDPLQTQRYAGPQPPNADHTYSLYVYALDTELSLKNGYWLNEFYQAIDGHLLNKVRIDFRSRK